MLFLYTREEDSFSFWIDINKDNNNRSILVDDSCLQGYSSLFMLIGEFRNPQIQSEFFHYSEENNNHFQIAKHILFIEKC